MLILGLQGSPRVTGNTACLLDLFLQAAAAQGARIRKLDASRTGISPCIGCGTCEKTGVCAIQDGGAAAGIFALLREADVIVLASPVYFYSMPAALKALIDRSQVLWARKYKFGLDDPLRGRRKGLVLALGATRGKKLFEGMALTAKYFFDAIGAEHIHMLGYRGIEKAGEIAHHPGVRDDIRDALKKIESLSGRKKILFAGRENACRSQMASAFTALLAGDRIETMDAGSKPANEINRQMVSAMAEIGIDMAYRSPRSIASVIETNSPPDKVVTMGCAGQYPFAPGTSCENWDIPDPAGQDAVFMRKARDEIRAKVTGLIG